MVPHGLGKGEKLFQKGCRGPFEHFRGDAVIAGSCAEFHPVESFVEFCQGWGVVEPFRRGTGGRYVLPDSVGDGGRSILDCCEMCLPRVSFLKGVFGDGAKATAGVVCLSDPELVHKFVKRIYSVAVGFGVFRLLTNGVPVFLFPLSESTAFQSFGSL